MDIAACAGLERRTPRSEAKCPDPGTQSSFRVIVNASRWLIPHYSKERCCKPPRTWTMPKQTLWRRKPTWKRPKRRRSRLKPTTTEPPCSRKIASWVSSNWIWRKPTMIPRARPWARQRRALHKPRRKSARKPRLWPWHKQTSTTRWFDLQSTARL